MQQRNDLGLNRSQLEGAISDHDSPIIRGSLNSHDTFWSLTMTRAEAQLMLETVPFGTSNLKIFRA